MRPLYLMWLVACASPLPPTAHTASVPLTPPWDALALPLDGATVRYSDADTVTAVYPVAAGPAGAVADRYVAALGTLGVTAGRRVDAGATLQQDLIQGDRALSLAIRTEGDYLVASLAWVPQ